MTQRLPFDPARLTPASRRFAERLFAAHDAFRSRAALTPQSGTELCSLYVEVASPTGDPRRTLALWLEGGEPHLSFGDWKTRAGVWGEADPAAPILRLLDAILSDRVVLLLDRDAAPDVHLGMVDLADRASVPAGLAADWSPDRFHFLSWSGAADRQARRDDLSAA